MKQYQLPFSVLRRFRNQYFEPISNRINDSVVYHGRNREVVLVPNRVCAEYCTNLRRYSSGFLGVDRIPTNYDDIHSEQVGEVSQNTNDINQLGQASDGDRSEGYWQSSGQFQNLSTPRNHYAANDWNSQNLGHHDPHNPCYLSGGNAGDYRQTTSDHWMRNSGPGELYKGNHDLQKPGYLSGGNAGEYQQTTADHWMRNSGPGDLYKGNKVASHPGSYQPENMGVQSGSNGYGQFNFSAGYPSGYYNGQPVSHQQNFISSHDPNILTQMPVSATPVGHSGEADGDNDRLRCVEGMLEELDAFCKEWDLEKAVKLMEELGEKGVHIDLSRYLTLIRACGEGKAVEEAKAVHKHLMRFISPVKVSTFNRILEMYGKCGLMEDALNTFNQMPERNLTSWDTMITWYARNGLGEDAIDMFTRFKEAGLKPDGQMFFAVFDACGVIGDVTEGILHFDSMSKIYGIIPSMAHYARIIHMFGSAGYLDGALEFIEKMPVEPSVDVWESLMNISRIQGNIALGDRCAQIVERLDPSRLNEQSKAGLVPVKDSETLKKKVKKANPLEHTKHEYRAGDRSHPENDKIYATLRGIKESLKEAGYIPETRFVLHDIDPEGKEEAIMAHSERLACTYALLTSSARMPIRIIKNLRVCGDCHNAFKIISKLVGREVIMRDAKRFHHFKDGKCSCNDYW